MKMSLIGMLGPVEVMVFIWHLLVYIKQTASTFCWIWGFQGSDFQQYDILNSNVLHPK
jgi:hypothetical protein